MYDTPDWIQMIQDIGIVLAVITAFITAVMAVGRFLIVKPLERYIDARMPANGGKSLRELHEKTDELMGRMVRIETELVRIDEEIEEIAH